MSDQHEIIAALETRLGEVEQELAAQRQSPPVTTSRLSRRRLVAVGLVVALLAVPGVVLAGHRFSDVPNGHPFHDPISAIAEAGITGGFGDGTYRPANNVTRQAMAAFLERAVGRAGYSEGVGTIGTNPGLARRYVLGDVSMRAGAAGAGTGGYVLLTGTVSAHTANVGSCPCLLRIAMAADGQTYARTQVAIPSVASESGFAHVAGTAHALIPIAGDQSASYQLTVELVDTNVASVGVSGHMTALYVPFDPGYTTSQCVGSEAEPNGARASATSLTPGTCLYGSLSAGDLDYFSIGVAAGQTLTVETGSRDGAGCLGDTLLFLQDVAGNDIYYDDDNGSGLCSKIERSGLATGTYYLRVEAYDSQHEFHYRITATVAATSPSQPDTDMDDVAKD